jgi:hypothetical protein
MAFMLLRRRPGVEPVRIHAWIGAAVLLGLVVFGAGCSGAAVDGQTAAGPAHAEVQNEGPSVGVFRMFQRDWRYEERQRKAWSLLHGGVQTGVKEYPSELDIAVKQREVMAQAILSYDGEIPMLTLYIRNGLDDVIRLFPLGLMPTVMADATGHSSLIAWSRLHGSSRGPSEGESVRLGPGEVVSRSVRFDVIAPEIFVDRVGWPSIREVTVSVEVDYFQYKECDPPQRHVVRYLCGFDPFTLRELAIAEDKRRRAEYK